MGEGKAICSQGDLGRHSSSDGIAASGVLGKVLFASPFPWKMDTVCTVEVQPELCNRRMDRKAPRRGTFRKKM